MQLGLELHDLEYNWELHVGKFPNISPDDWKTQKSRLNQERYIVDFFPIKDVSSLNPEQRQIYDLVVEKYG